MRIFLIQNNEMTLKFRDLLLQLKHYNFPIFIDHTVIIYIVQENKFRLIGAILGLGA